MCKEFYLQQGGIQSMIQRLVQTATMASVNGSGNSIHSLPILNGMTSGL